MNIAINTLSENPYAPSGAQGYFINLLRELSVVGKGHEFYLFVSRANQHLFGPYENDNMHKIVFPYSNERQLRRVLTEHFGFAPIIQKYAIDVLNTGVAILRCPCKLVVTMKTMHAYTNPAELPLKTLLYRRLVYKWTVKKADKIISNSRSHTEDLLKYLPLKESKIALVYEALDHNLFKPIDDPAGFDDVLRSLGIHRPFILFVSSLWPYKNAETLISAFAKIRTQLKEYQLVIAGFARDQQYLSSLKEQVSALGIQKKVLFTGGLVHEKLARLYQTATVFVYPSLYETFGLTILEAMACGCPVITSNVSSMPEIAGDAAILFEPGDADELASKILTLLTHNELYRERREAGLKRAGEFTWRQTAIDTLQALVSA